MGKERYWSENLEILWSPCQQHQYLHILPQSQYRMIAKGKAVIFDPNDTALICELAYFIQEIEILLDRFCIFSNNYLLLLQTRVLSRFSGKRMWKQLLSKRPPAMHRIRSKHFLASEALSFSSRIRRMEFLLRRRNMREFWCALDFWSWRGQKGKTDAQFELGKARPTRQKIFTQDTLLDFHIFIYKMFNDARRLWCVMGGAS